MNPQNFWQLAAGQSFPVILLLAIAYVLWQNVRAEMKKKDAQYERLDKKCEDLETELRQTIRQSQAEYLKLSERTTAVLEENTAVLHELKPLLEHKNNFR